MRAFVNDVRAMTWKSTEGRTKTAQIKANKDDKMVAVCSRCLRSYICAV